MVRLLGSVAMPDQKQTEGQSEIPLPGSAGNSPRRGILTNRAPEHTQIH
jgi:hypothetical protein